MKTTFTQAMAAVMDRYAHEWRVISHCETDDDRLQVLWNRTAEVNHDVQNIIQLRAAEGAMLEANLKISLVATAAVACAWLTSAPLNSRAESYRRIRAERMRQTELFRRQRISFDVASPIIDVRRKFRVLGEKAGEVAHAIDQIENHGMARGNLRMELVQVAAVCVAWLESFEV